MEGQTERSTGDWTQPKKGNLLQIENRKLATLDQVKAPEKMTIFY